MELDKISTIGWDEDKRRYDDACAAAHGMDLIGERWSMPLIRELLLGPRRFGDLKASLNGISANVLTQRLAGLEAAGVLVRRKLPPPASVQVYELTPWGYESAPIFQALGRWAVRSPRHDVTRPFSPTSLMLALRTMMSADAAGDFAARIQLQMAGEPYFWIREDGEVRIGRGAIDHPDLTIAGTPSDVAAVVYAGAPADMITVAGDRGLMQRFITLFPMPAKAALAES
ncbi:helix-turn-helix domain-containing protein [Sphingomonas sp.]|uniref:winged helix-turn-helix transcriptional regulator n=1 Tax=Sphingomonas sp. TaxID=28214 RepID=UPI00286BC259|nr:helix-turn-helix domain-containing protein [Sphingomonas sp.]